MSHDVSTVEARKAFSQSFMPQIVEILRNLFPGQEIRLADIVTDKTKATDVLVGDIGMVNVRARNAKYMAKYHDEITFRSSARGADPEILKVLQGMGNFMVYAFIALDSVVAYWLIDLSGMRQDWINGRVKVGRRMPNIDGSSFVPVKLSEEYAWATFVDLRKKAN